LDFANSEFVAAKEKLEIVICMAGEDKLRESTFFVFKKFDEVV